MIHCHIAKYITGWFLNAPILSVLLYGCETWTLLEADEQKLEAFYRSCRRQILGVCWYHFVSNASVTNQTSQTACVAGSAADA